MHCVQECRSEAITQPEDRLSHILCLHASLTTGRVEWQSRSPLSPDPGFFPATALCLAMSSRIVMLVVLSLCNLIPGNHALGELSTSCPCS